MWPRKFQQLLILDLLADLSLKSNITQRIDLVVLTVRGLCSCTLWKTGTQINCIKKKPNFQGHFKVLEESKVCETRKHN